MKAGIYARYSSEMQRDASIDDQIRNCRAFAERQGWDVNERCVFTDRAVSGTVSDRPGYRAIAEAAREGRFDVLIVDDLSRVARDAAETHHLHNRLRFWGVSLVAIADGIDTTVSARSSGLMIGIKAAMNEEYVRDLAEKTRRGLAGRVHAGLSPGGQPYGYSSEPVCDDPPRLDRHGQPQVIGYRRVIVPEEAQVVRRIFQLYVQGHSSRRIAESLNAEGVPPPGRRWRNREKTAAHTWSMSAIEGSKKKGLGILNNEAYLGKIIWNKFEWRRDPDSQQGSGSGRPRRVPIMRPREEWIVHEDESLRIVSDELWQAAKDAQARRSAGLRKTGRRPVDGRHRYLLSGLLRCGVCGGGMAMRSRHGYGCATRANRGAALCSNSGVVNRQALEAAILAAVRDELYGRGLIAELTRRVRSYLVAISRERQSADRAGARQRRVARTQQEIDRVTASLRRCQTQGRVHAAEHLEAELDALLAARKALEQKGDRGSDQLGTRLQEAMPRLPGLVSRHVDELSGLLKRGHVGLVQSALAALVDETEVMPGETEEGRPWHLVRVKGALDRAFSLLRGRRQTLLVAGACFVAMHNALAAVLVRRWRLPRNGRRR